MTTDDKIRDGKLQYGINREAAKISVLSSGKIDDYELLTGEEIMAFNKRQIIQQAKFAFCLLGEAFEKQKKQPGVIESLDLSFLTPKPATEATPT